MEQWDIKDRLNSMSADTVLDIATEPEPGETYLALMALPQMEAVKLLLGRLAIERSKVENLLHERNHKPQRG